MFESQFSLCIRSRSPVKQMDKTTTASLSSLRSAKGLSRVYSTVPRHPQAIFHKESLPRLLSLPVEIRTLIYDELLVNPVVRYVLAGPKSHRPCLFLPKSGAPVPTRTEKRLCLFPPHLEILFTCKLIHGEAASVLYGKNDFRILNSLDPSAVRSTIRKMGDKWRFIRRLELDYDPSAFIEGSFSKTITTGGSNKHLHTLRLVMSDSYFECYSFDYWCRRISEDLSALNVLHMIDIQLCNRTIWAIPRIDERLRKLVSLVARKKDWRIAEAQEVRRDVLDCRNRLRHGDNTWPRQIGFCEQVMAR